MLAIVQKVLEVKGAWGSEIQIPGRNAGYCAEGIRSSILEMS